MNKKGKIIAHLLGGGGINIGYKVLSKVAMLGDGFAEWEFHCADTSRNNYDNVDGVGDLFEIQRKTNDLKLAVAGSGGDRRTLVNDIALNIPDYLAKHNIKQKETGVYHLIVCSLSGGTGNNIGILLADAFMARDIPFIFLGVGDSGDDTKLRNTQSSLATLSHKAVKANKCLLTYYVNNAEIGDGTLTGAVEKANNHIKNMAGFLSLFLSGENAEIDHTDIEYFLCPHKLTTLTIPAGVYTITFHGGGEEIKLPDYAVPAVARTLSIAGKEVEFPIHTRNHKLGYIVNENAISKFDKHAPIHIISSNGMLKAEVEKLTQANEAALAIQKSLVNCNLEAPKHAVTDDELDMMF